jgi:hypothetical protein
MSRNEVLTEAMVAKLFDTALAKATGQPANTPAIVAPFTWPMTNDKGRPQLNSVVNVAYALKKLGIDLRYNELTRRDEIGKNDLLRNVSDTEALALLSLIADEFRVEFTWDATRRGVQKRCRENPYNPVKDYLRSLYGKHDGKSRIDTWLIDYCGADDTPLIRAQGRIFIQAMVARAFRPGTKFDSVLVLEGKEGIRKSTVARVLANGTIDRPQHFSDLPILKSDKKEQMEALQGVWVYELGELAHLNRGDAQAMKAFLARTADSAREAYAYYREDQDRSAVFLGSYNPDANTGEVYYLHVGDRRRWWPVRVKACDIAALIRDRDQLFAEAVAPYFDWDSGLDDFPNVPLYLPDDLQEQANAIAETREVRVGAADAAGELYDAVLNMKKTQNGPDGKTIKKQQRAIKIDEVLHPGVLLTKRDDAVPFAFVADDGLIWISSTFAKTYTKATDGNIGSAMGKHGWRDRMLRPGTKKPQRGWLNRIETEE